MESSKTLVLAYSLLALLLGLSAYPIASSFLATKPYYDVVERLVDWDEDDVTLSYTFHKNGDCELKTFSVVGISGEIPKYLKYEDADGLSEDFDREQGTQGLNITVHFEGDYYDKVELRTRHLCGEEVVQKVFASVKNPEG